MDANKNYATVPQTLYLFGAKMQKRLLKSSKLMRHCDDSFKHFLQDRHQVLYQPMGRIEGLEVTDTAQSSKDHWGIARHAIDRCDKGNSTGNKASI
eukprot:12302624-Ditylum_brightwellii.AAC.1